MVVHFSLDHHVHLHRRKTRSAGGIDALEHAREWNVRVAHRLEDVLVERVEADCHPAQAKLAAPARQLAEE